VTIWAPVAFDASVHPAVSQKAQQRRGTPSGTGRELLLSGTKTPHA